jgi:CDP-diacylglycerol--serine O-phosphatidyltransferase
MSDRFLIRLNAVDIISLTGLTLTGLALWLISSGQMTFALAVLYLAMLADALDGHFARRWNLAREFGRYLDGFVDTFLYLVAPAFWLWQWGFNGLFAAVLIWAVWVSGIVRLSVFNIAGNDTLGGRLVYQGMPVFWLLFFIGGAQILAWLAGKATALGMLYILWPVSAALMIWNRPFFKFTRLSHILILVLGGATVFAVAGLQEAYS